MTFELPEESGGRLMLFPDAPVAQQRGVLQNDAGDVEVVLPADADARFARYLEELRADPAYEAWVEGINHQLSLPHDVPVRHGECGVANAYYSPTDNEVVLCWELLAQLARIANDPAIDDETAARFVGSTWLFITFHEVGHALVDAYDLPIVGREEDAVDDLATLLLIREGATDAAIDAASFWRFTETGQHSEVEFADEHSFGGQRYYAILCLVVGSDPVEYGWIVDEGYLPREPERCVAEFERKDTGWSRLLAPWEPVGDAAGADAAT